MALLSAAERPRRAEKPQRQTAPFGHSSGEQERTRAAALRTPHLRNAAGVVALLFRIYDRCEHSSLLSEGCETRTDQRLEKHTRLCARTRRASAHSPAAAAAAVVVVVVLSSHGAPLFSAANGPPCQRTVAVRRELRKGWRWGEENEGLSRLSKYTQTIVIIHHSPRIMHHHCMHHPQSSAESAVAETKQCNCKVSVGGVTRLPVLGESTCASPRTQSQHTSSYRTPRPVAC